MFKVAKNRTFTRDVKIFTPTDAGFAEETLKTTFALLSVDEARKFDLTRPEGADGFLDAVVRKFSELTDDQDKPLPCTDDVRAFLLKQPHVRHGLISDYFAAVANDGPQTGN